MICKTIITLTVLLEADSVEDAANILDGLSVGTIVAEADEGEFIMSDKRQYPVAVPKGAVRRELKAIGNDGSFFDLMPDPEVPARRGL